MKQSYFKIPGWFNYSESYDVIVDEIAERVVKGVSDYGNAFQLFVKEKFSLRREVTLIEDLYKKIV